MLIGFHTNRDLATALADFPQARVVRVFPSGMPVDVTKTTPAQFITLIKNACDPVIALGLIPAFSFKFAGEPSVITSGKADAHIDALSVYLNADQESRIAAWHHEDDGTGISGADFVAAYSHVFGKIAKLGKFYFGPIYEGYVWRAKKFDPSFLPPVNTYSFLGIDVYTSDWDISQGDLSKHTQFQNFLAGTPAQAPIFLTERGITTGAGAKPPAPAGQQATIMELDYRYLQGLGARVMGYLYWDSTGATDTSVFSLDAEGKAQLREMANEQNPPEVYAPANVIGCSTCFSVIDASKVAEHYAALKHVPII